MQITKTDERWRVVIEDQDNQLGLINTVRYLENLTEELNDVPEGLILEVNLEHLRSVNSELIAQFVNLQTTLVRSDGRLRITEANPELKSAFDVVMLDKIISIHYAGQSEDADDSEE